MKDNSDFKTWWHQLTQAEQLDFIKSVLERGAEDGTFKQLPDGRWRLTPKEERVAAAMRESEDEQLH